MFRKDCHRTASLHSGHFPRWLLGILWSVLLTSLPCQATEKPSTLFYPPSVSMSLHNGYLTAHIVATPIQQVMQKLSRVSGAKMVWQSPPNEHLVSVAFFSLPLAEAVQRIVGAHNFLLIFSSTAETARLTQIWLSAPPQSQTRGDTTQSRPSVTPIRMEKEAASTTSEGEDAEERARLESALQVVTQTQDVATHLTAIEILAPYVTVDPQVRITLSHLAQSAQDSQVQEAAAAALAEE
jgi:hypothetical protein